MSEPTSVTYAEREDFTVHMLKEICDRAAVSANVLDMVNYTLKRADTAINQPKDPSAPKVINQSHTRALQAWDSFMDLYVHRQDLHLDNPRKDVPLHYYFTPSQCDFAFRRIDTVMATAEILYVTWRGSRDIVMPIFSMCIEHILEKEKTT